jgi:hypothetical protein
VVRRLTCAHTACFARIGLGLAASTLALSLSPEKPPSGAVPPGHPGPTAEIPIDAGSACAVLA